MDYGTRRRALARRPRRPWWRRRAAALGAAGFVVAASLSFAGWRALAHDGAEPQLAVAAPASVAPADASAPTAPPRHKIGALAEGSVPLPAGDVHPPASEKRANGGHRFAQPVAAFSAIDDWFGTPRQYGTIHGGVDFGLETLGPVPVVAACAGTVTEAMTDDRLGPHVRVDCGEGWSTLVAYLGAVTATAGQAVARGDVLGVSDDVDRFVHFQIEYMGEPVDPADYIALPPRPLATADAHAHLHRPRVRP